MALSCLDPAKKCLVVLVIVISAVVPGCTTAIVTVPVYNGGDTDCKTRGLKQLNPFASGASCPAD